MSKSPVKKLPIKLAKDVLKKYKLKQVIVMCMDENDIHHFVTCGDTKESCKEAAISADRLKIAIGWPEGSLSKYVTECLVPGCSAKMPHLHNNENGEVE